MTRTTRITNLLGVFGPIAGVIVAIVLLWNRFVGPEVLVLTAVLYVLTGIGTTVGLHRLFAHRSFAAKKSVRATLAVLGTMALQGPVIRWVTNHRKHHQHADEEGDPHSPHLSGHAGLWGAVTGLYHATWAGSSKGSARNGNATRPTCWPIRSPRSSTARRWSG